MIDERLRQRCIEGVVEEGERFGVLAAELDGGRPADVVVRGDPAAEALLRGR